MRTRSRYDEEKGIYRDCKWCGGEGCNFCPGEAEKAYKREFPNGPQPIATFPNTKEGTKNALKFALKHLREQEEEASKTPEERFRELLEKGISVNTGLKGG